jgi:hypothetical protein
MVERSPFQKIIFGAETQAQTSRRNGVKKRHDRAESITLNPQSDDTDTNLIASQCA